MGLVDYGSDSDSDTSPPPTTSTASKPLVTSSTSSSLLSLPPPKSSLNLPVPSTSKLTTTTIKPNLPPPKKKEKGPVRILLDLPAAQSEEDQGPAKKRPKLALGSGSGLSGLAAMLPKPKNEVKQTPQLVAQPKSTSTSLTSAGLGDMFEGGSTGAEEAEKKPVGMFAPPSMRGKGKGKAVSTSTAAPPPPAVEPAVDFFGIASLKIKTEVNKLFAGSVTSSSSANSASASSRPAFSSAPSISSAPSLPSASSSQPSASDPYPGFTQLPSGGWVAKDQKTYELALQWQAQQAAEQGGGEELPKGFEEKEIAEKGGYKDVDEATRAREAWATRPSQLPGKEEEFKKSAQIKGIPKQATQQARRKGQLSSLLADAHDNRAELEERIAQARLNRKSAGNKYGF
ncbi:hypothetical protein JCM5353_007115 [Sporobolomyces roseus]